MQFPTAALIPAINCNCLLWLAWSRKQPPALCSFLLSFLFEHFLLLPVSCSPSGPFERDNKILVQIERTRYKRLWECIYVYSMKPENRLSWVLVSNCSINPSANMLQPQRRKQKRTSRHCRTPSRDPSQRTPYLLILQKCERWRPSPRIKWAVILFCCWRLQKGYREMISDKEC